MGVKAFGGGATLDDGSSPDTRSILKETFLRD